MTQVIIFMGSDSDYDYMEAAIEELEKCGITYEVFVASAHRTPERVKKLIEESEENGAEVIIAGAGGAAHLAGVIASHSILPVIGVPLPTLGLGGADALLATVQMPRGIPVATVGMGNSANSALLAIQIIALHNEKARKYMENYRLQLKEKVIKKHNNVMKRLNK
ncbi:MAG: 5-(carboxyamino)imidazole ribonucleotide mutase [Myxococcota bacterium]